MSAINTKIATFTASDTSDVVDLKSEAVMQIRTPNSFTATSITVLGKNADGDFEVVKLVDSTLAATDFVLTVDGTTGYSYDITSVFPAGTREVQLLASTSITDTVEIITRRID